MKRTDRMPDGSVRTMTSVTPIVHNPNAEAFKAEITPWIEEANQIVVRNTEQYEAVCVKLKLIKGWMKRVKEDFNPMVSAAKTTYDRAKDLRDKVLSLAPVVEARYKEKLLIYDREEERKERCRQIEAEAKARKEQKRLDEIAQKKAAAAEKKGDSEKAEAIIETASQVQVPIKPVETNRVKVSGIKKRVTWKARVIDKKKLHWEYLLANQSALDAFARNTKGTVPMDGVEFYKDETLAAGSM